MHPIQMQWGQAARTGCVRPGLGSPECGLVHLTYFFLMSFLCEVIRDPI